MSRSDGFQHFPPPPPEPVPGCETCAGFVAQERAAVAAFDRSAASDARVYLHRHLGEAHR
ncbi:hypothetical protein GXW83_07075 [Streptacidiphilus sp. PB12-B1b]|uniref:hypothetical protein n=1 Tax=Streptacidiphilus sp. PB12-B1b TaxID=2705012 RepID=UPI0015F7A936|nr:hypothetical protein [Streptacidiphilus sp. PB12-B1b]QMU75536.1 hypothetical protein GXW83_07075 [Streptacidiphilus sp. PB12-B1b]